MSKSSEHSDDMAEARRLIDAACDGRLTAPQATRLEKLARARHEVLILYIEMMHLTAWLHQHAAAMGADPAQQPVQDLNESMILPAIRPEDIEDALDQPEPAPSWELPRRHSSRRRLWATAASVLIAAIVLSFVLRSVLRTSAGLHATQVASVVRSIQAGWEGQSPGQVLTAGREYALKTGLVELNLSETRVVVQGPARFTMLDSRMIELKNGMLTALCAKGGLSVKTPNAAVLDLGTEFGVRVDDAGTDVEVFQGRVSLTPAIAGTQKDGNLQSGTILEVGVAKRVNPTGTV
ncbi:MAG TPA: FecR domain-containing protein, partial [Tepidisphaeraceae bacterium]|nr:FecR domain-containing protein [Tepidisphaeraceae bacterium]